MTLRIKRLTASISAGIEDVVAKLENHEAVADCLLEELRQGIAQVRVQQARIDAQAKKTKTQLEAAKDDQVLWNERALQLADEDEAKALQCVQRATHSEKVAVTLSEQLLAQETTVSELGARLIEMEGQLSDLNLKRASLSSRELRAKASRSAGRSDGGESVTRLFDRWETSVMTEEYAGSLGPIGGHISNDALERELSEAENQAELKAKLAQLKNANLPGGES